MKYNIMKYIITILLIVFTAEAQVKICSETGMNYQKAEIILLGEHNEILNSYEININEKVKPKGKYNKIAIQLPDHLPIIYNKKIKNPIDLTLQDNVTAPYKIIGDKACAIYGDLNKDFSINALDLYIANKMIQENKLNEELRNIIIENNNKLYHVKIKK